ncbi:peptidoglycan-associated lipoprotein Pal, partial [Magnetococcales bacterium HHB-1]
GYAIITSEFSMMRAVCQQLFRSSDLTRVMLDAIFNTWETLAMQKRIINLKTTITAILLTVVLAGCGSVPVQAPEPSQTTDTSTKGDQEQGSSQILNRPSNDGIDLDTPADVEETDIVEPKHRVFFDFDSALITDDAARILEKNARWLASQEGTIVVEGHCDERGTREYNLALGQKRADAVKRYLITQGIDPDRIQTITYGKERPLHRGHNESSWAKNRRSEILIQQTQD